MCFCGKPSVFWLGRRAYYGAQNDYTHIFIVWELISPLHRTSVTLSFLAGILLWKFGCLHEVFSVHVPITHMNCLGINFPITHTSVTQKNCFRIICVIISGLIAMAPTLRYTARLSQRYPPIARYGAFGVSAWLLGCDAPPPFLSIPPWRACKVEVRRYFFTKGVSQRCGSYRGCLSPFST